MRLLSGRYRLGEVLGYGGMAEVYKARDVRLDRDVAIKVLRADLARDSSFKTRFRREAQSAAALAHPMIVSVYDTGSDERHDPPLPYIVMEYVEGHTLRDVLHLDGPADAEPGRGNHRATSARRSSTATAPASCIATSSRATS